MLGNFVKARFIRDAEDLSKVPFTNRASQLDLGLGTAARRFLSEGIVNAEEDDDDVVENEGRFVISPQDAAKLYK